MLTCWDPNNKCPYIKKSGQYEHQASSIYAVSMPGIPDTRYYSHWRSDAPHDIIVSIGQLGKCNNNYANKIGQGNAGDLARELFAIKTWKSCRKCKIQTKEFYVLVGRVNTRHLVPRSAEWHPWLGGGDTDSLGLIIHQVGPAKAFNVNLV